MKSTQIGETAHLGELGALGAKSLLIGVEYYVFAGFCFVHVMIKINSRYVHNYIHICQLHTSETMKFPGRVIQHTCYLSDNILVLHMYFFLSTYLVYRRYILPGVIDIKVPATKQPNTFNQNISFNCQLCYSFLVNDVPRKS